MMLLEIGSYCFFARQQQTSGNFVRHNN